MVGSSRFGVRRASARRSGVGRQLQGRWSLTAPVFRGFSSDPAEQRRALCELLLERYGVVTREQVLAEGIKGGFASLYEAFSNLETLGVCRRGYFIEGMGGAQFALPGAVERLRAVRTGSEGAPGAGERTLVIAAADPAQPYGAALPWPKREWLKRRPARVAGAYVVMVDEQPALYVERGGRGLQTLTDAPAHRALGALSEAVRAGRVGKLALERIDGEPAIASELAQALVELGFHSGPRRLTLTA
jgi:ATP-dependent Lhr-like helicase